MAALSGLQIQKLLPKTNCKECGSSTCMAFAMKLAAKKAILSECPYASDEAKSILGAASEPPVKGIKIGNEIVSSLGEETVFYRHEKTFVNQTVIAINLPENTDITEAKRIRDYKLERVGEILTVGAIAVTQAIPGALGGMSDAGSYADYAAKVYEETGLPLILRANDDESAVQAAKAVAGSKSIIANVTTDNMAQLKAAAEENGHILAVTAEDMDGIFALTAQIKEGGFNDMVIEFQTHSLAEEFQTNSIARKAALKNSVKPLGYASLKWIDSGDDITDTVTAVTEITKFGGIIVLPHFEPAQLVTLMTLRQNIYTDPQKPIQVEPKLYEIGEPDRNAPIFVTTNFSLTYFLVSGEIENAGISAWLVIPECEGMSVLTAWAAGKFSGAQIAKYIKEFDLESKVDTRQIVIPGYVAQISGELEESLPGFKVLVGPGESADLESFIKTVLNQ